MYRRVYVEITNQCNGHCSFCPGTTRPPRMMTLEEFTKIAQKLQGVTKYIYYHVLGEPLTHPDLPKMIEIAGKMGFRSAITTNGTLLPERGAAIVEAGVYKVNISVHSFEEGTEENYINYINNCLEFGDMASRRGTITVFRLWNQGCDGGRNNRTLELMHTRFPGAWKESERGIRIQNRLFLEYGERFEWPDLEAEDQGYQIFCYGLRDHFGILCDGTVIPCCLDHDGEIALGNIWTQEIRKIVTSPRAKAIVDGFSQRKASEELCRKCGYARRFS